MIERDPWRETVTGARGRPPDFVVALLVLLGAGMIADAFVELRPLVAWLRLDPAVWQHGQLWRLVTFGLVGEGGLSLWGAMQLVVIYWFTVELCVLMGAARVRVLLLGGIVIAGSAAVLTQLAWEGVGGERSPFAFWMVQGQRIVMAIVVPAFASRHLHTTLETPLLFGLPIPSRWLIALQLLFALATFAALRDTGGMMGVLVATVWGARALRRHRKRR